MNLFIVHWLHKEENLLSYGLLLISFTTTEL